MGLTSAQLTTLKNDIANNTNTILVAGVSTQIKNVPHNPDLAPDVASWYNLQASPNYFLVRSEAPVVDILNAVMWANFTPKDAVTGANAAQAMACSAYCQGKMLNIQTMLTGRTVFDATRATQTGGLKDGTTQLPSNTSFANQTGGWPNIIPILQRQATNVEKLLALASAVSDLRNAASARGTQYDGTNGNPDVPGFEGKLTGNDIVNAWNS